MHNVRVVAGRAVIAAIVLGAATFVQSGTAHAVAPANDDFSTPQVLDGEMGTTSGSTLEATSEPGEPAHAGVGENSVWFRWQAPFRGDATFDTFGSDFDTVLAVYTGDAVDTLAHVASNDDAGSLQSQVRFTAEEGTSYAVAVAGFSGATGSYVLNWTVAEPPPPPDNDNFADALTLADDSGEVTGTNVGASVEPDEPSHADTGGASVWYQWVSGVDGAAQFETHGSDFDTVVAVYTGDAVDNLTLVASHDNVNASIRTSSVLFRAEPETTYSIAVAGARHDTGSIRLTWSSADGPANDFFADAQVIGGPSGTVSGSNVGATAERPGEPGHDRGEDASVWYRWTAPAHDAFSFDTFGSGIDTVVAIYTGDAIDDLTLVALDDDSGGPQSQTSFVANEDVVYSIAVASFSSDTGDFTLTWAPVDPASRPRNDDFGDAQRLDGASGSVMGTNVGATRETGEPGHPALDQASVWYSWVAPFDGALSIDIATADFDARADLYTGEAVDALDRVPSRPFIDVAEGATYHVAITGFQGDTGTFTVQWEAAAAPLNDDFTGAATLDGTAGAATGSIVGATLEPGEPDHDHDFRGAQASVWYSWVAPVDGLANFEVASDAFRSVVAVYTGATVDTLDVVDSDAAPGRGEPSAVTVPVTAGTPYALAVATTSTRDRGDFTLSWVSFGPAPNDDFADAEVLPVTGSLTATNLGATVESGEPPHLGTGGSSVWYRWAASEDGPVTFETLGSGFDTVLAVYQGTMVGDLALVAQSDDGGVFDDWSNLRFEATAGDEYMIAVDGAFGVEGIFDLSWYGPPPNDAFAVRETIADAEGSVLGTTRGATTEAGEPDAGSETVWFRWVAPADGPVIFESSGEHFTMLSSFTGRTLDTLELVSQGRSSVVTDRTAVMRIEGEAGTEYAIAVGSVGSSLPRTGDFQLTWHGPIAGDDFADAVVVSGTEVDVSATAVGATREDGEPLHAGGEGPSVWYRWTAPTDGGVSIDTLDTPSRFDTTLGVYTGDRVEDLSLVVANDDFDHIDVVEVRSLVRFTAQAGHVYSIAVSGRSPSEQAPFDLTLRVTPTPANDAFANAPSLGGAEGRITVLTAGATAEPGEPVHAGSGGASVWYSWTAADDGAVAFDTQGSDFNTVLAAYVGDTVDELSLATENDDVFLRRARLYSRISFPTTAGTTYHIAVSGVAGRVGDATLSWMPTSGPAHDNLVDARSITGATGRFQDSNDAATVEPGEPLHAGVARTSVWYSWTPPETTAVTFEASFTPADLAIAIYTGTSLDGLELVAARDDNRLGTAEVTFRARAGRTYAIAVGGVGNATASSFDLSWRPVTPPANDDFTDARVIEGTSGRVDGTNVAATIEPGEPDHGGSGGASVWYEWTAAASGRFVFDTYESRFDLDTVVAIYTGDAVDALTLVTENDDGPGTTKSLVILEARAGTTYRVAVDGFGGSAGPISLQWRKAAGNDDFADAEVLTGREGSLGGHNFGAGTEPGEPSHDSATETGASVWYEWESPFTGPVQFEASRDLESPGSRLDGVIAAYTGQAVDALTPIADTSDIPFAITRFDAVAGTTYRLAVAGRDRGEGAALGTFELTWQGPPPNDRFDDAEVITGLDGTSTGRTGFASTEPDEPRHLGTGGSSIWYRWTAPYRGVVTFDTVGSFNRNRQGVGNSGRVFDTVLAAYGGETVDQLELLAQSNDAAPGVRDSRIGLFVERGQTVHVAVDVNSPGGGGGDVILNWTHDVFPPANDHVLAAEIISGRSGFADGTLVEATTEPGEPDHGGIGTSVWYSWSAPHTGTATFDAGGAAVVRAYTGAAAAELEPVTATGDPSDPALRFHVQKDQTYLIAVDGRETPHDFTLSWATPQPPPPTEAPPT